MALYVFSLVVGYLPHGVDNAQGYRAKILENFPCSVKYIFTDLPTRQSIDYYGKVGIDMGQMLSVHQYFTDSTGMELSVKAGDKLEELRESYTDVRYLDWKISLLRNGERTAEILLNERNGNYCSAVNYFKGGNLIRTEKYLGEVCYAESYVTAKDDKKLYAKVVRRTFYNRDGSVAYDQLFEAKREWYIFPDGRRLTKAQFLAEFVKKLDLGEGDTVLLDRSAQFDFVQPLFQFGKKARFIAVFHSGHYFEKGEDTNRLYLNYEYYYWFKNAGRIDTMVVSTEEQKEELTEKLKECHCSIPNIAVIPAGGIDRIKIPDTERRPCSLLTVSRLDKRKKIEWIIRSVVKAHQKNSRISLDIYGRGSDNYTRYLEEIVTLNQAQSYIRFMGHVDAEEIYKNYEVYIAASLWETLGLSLMEAVASGNAMIGLNVKYGNRLFIRSGENGYLVDFHVDDTDDDSRLIEDMAEKIVEVFKDQERLEKFHCRSYEIAEEFSTKRIEGQWKILLEERRK